MTHKHTVFHTTVDSVSKTLFSSIGGLVTHSLSHWPHDFKTKTMTKTLRAIQWFSDQVDYSWQIETLNSWHWGLMTDSQRVTWTVFTILICTMLLYLGGIAKLKHDQSSPPQQVVIRHLVCLIKSNCCWLWSGLSQLLYRSGAMNLSLVFASDTNEQ